MGPGQKFLTVTLWGLLVVAMLALVGSGVLATRQDSTRPITLEPEQEQHLPPLFDAPGFSLTDQNNRNITTETLRGRVWIASFVFTQCAGPCPMMTAKMASLQEAIPNPRVMLVSFTVDPERDTPEVLKTYADQFGADESRWHTLTGTQDQMMDVARGMYITAIPATDDSPIIHSERFLLVDHEGVIRGIYSSGDPEQMKALADDARELAEQAS